MIMGIFKFSNCLKPVRSILLQPKNMAKSKIYLDTSILSAYFDSRKPMRQLMTQKWCQNDLKNFSPFVSTLVLEEINAHPDKDESNKMLRLINDHAMKILEIITIENLGGDKYGSL